MAEILRAAIHTRGAHFLPPDIQDEDVLLIEDIVDTGFTTRFLLQSLAGRSPRSIGICTLLDRKVRRIVQVPVDFSCFEIPGRFVAGYGAVLAPGRDPGNTPARPEIAPLA